MTNGCRRHPESAATHPAETEGGERQHQSVARAAILLRDGPSANFRVAQPVTSSRSEIAFDRLPEHVLRFTTLRGWRLTDAQFLRRGDLVVRDVPHAGRHAALMVG